MLCKAGSPFAQVCKGACFDCALGNHDLSKVVLEVVAKLMSAMKSSRIFSPIRSTHTNERVSEEQRDVFLDKLRALGKDAT